MPTPETRPHRCQSCHWAHRLEPDPNLPSALECRRYPPQVYWLHEDDGGDAEALQAWPEVQRGDFCGEWTQ